MEIYTYIHTYIILLQTFRIDFELAQNCNVCAVIQNIKYNMISLVIPDLYIVTKRGGA